MAPKLRSWWGVVLAALVALAAPLVVRAQQVPKVLNVVPPPLVGGPWLNTPEGKPLSLKARRGKVTLVHYWTFGCINCQRNLPTYQKWQKEFPEMTILGIHTPETEAEKVDENVVKKVKELEITYPVLMDQKGENWQRWGQYWWPTIYLIDKRGRARYAWFGELEYQKAGGTAMMEARIQQLLSEKL